MQDRTISRAGDRLRRAVLVGLSLIAIVAAAVIVPRLGWPAGLGLLGMVTLVLVVVLLAAAPDDDAGEGASDPAP